MVYLLPYMEHEIECQRSAEEIIDRLEELLKF